MGSKLTYWAYCCYREHEGRSARGFVLAANRADAVKKARRRVTHERRRFAVENKIAGLPPIPKRGTYCVRVWRDPNRETAPRTARHYVERLKEVTA